MPAASPASSTSASTPTRARRSRRSIACHPRRSSKPRSSSSSASLSTASRSWSSRPTSPRSAWTRRPTFAPPKPAWYPAARDPRAERRPGGPALGDPRVHRAGADRRQHRAARDPRDRVADPSGPRPHAHADRLVPPRLLPGSRRHVALLGSARRPLGHGEDARPRPGADRRGAPRREHGALVYRLHRADGRGGGRLRHAQPRVHHRGDVVGPAPAAPGARVFAALQTGGRASPALSLQAVVAPGRLAASRYLALAQAGGVLGRIAFGVLSDRTFGGRRRTPLTIAGCGSTLCSIAIAFTGPASPARWLVPLAVVFGFFGIGWNGVQHTLMAELAGPPPATTPPGPGLAVSSLRVTPGPPVLRPALQAAGRH